MRLRGRKGGLNPFHGHIGTPAQVCLVESSLAGAPLPDSGWGWMKPGLEWLNPPLPLSLLPPGSKRMQGESLARTMPPDKPQLGSRASLLCLSVLSWGLHLAMPLPPPLEWQTEKSQTGAAAPLPGRPQLGSQVRWDPLCLNLLILAGVCPCPRPCPLCSCDE